jgi:hydrogenase expression/formation protein HypE
MSDARTIPAPRRFRAVLFDFDGTLTRPDALDFTKIRLAIGCPLTSPILDYINSLPAGPEQDRARRTLDEFEREAARSSFPNDGAEDLIRRLNRRSIPCGILTRNTLASIRVALRNFTSLREADFSLIITRESPGRPKPHPDGVLEAARRFGVPPEDMLVVGDFVFDIAAGKSAGAVTALITNGQDTASSPRSSLLISVKADADYTVAGLDGLEGILGIRD